MTDRNEALRLAEWLAANYEADEIDQAAALLRQQADRIAEIEKEGAELFGKVFSLGYELGQMEDQRDQLRAEVERLRADAERYRWLRDNLESEWAICEWQDDPDGLGYYRDARAPEFVDAAIDHARTTHKDEG